MNKNIRTSLNRTFYFVPVEDYYNIKIRRYKISLLGTRLIKNMIIEYEKLINDTEVNYIT